MRRSALAAAFLCFATILATGASAAEEARAPEKAADKAPAKPEEPPKKFVRQQRLRIGSVDVTYTSTAEEIVLKDADGKSTASFFTISYEKDVPKKEARPITFVFNGGPGSASIWLHLGLVGPKIIDIPSDAQDPGAPPYRLRDNPWTILRATDLVFIDPVGTGFSRAMGEKKDEDYWGYDEDADSVAEFIRTFISTHNRWNSPKYLLGESYGGIRSSLLVPRLQNRLGIGLNGVILVSPALNLGTLPFVTTGNDLSYATNLPALAATAFYHRRLPDQWSDLATLTKAAEEFAATDYLLALFAGDRIDAARKDRIAESLHRFTGLDKNYILRSELRISSARFAKELLRDRGKAIGYLDSRYVQDEIDNVSEVPNSDPFSAKTGPIYVATFQSYIRNELGVDITTRYIPSNDDAGGKWKRPVNGRGAFAGFVDVTGALAQGTKDNEALRIFSAAGYNDLVTTYSSHKYMFEHSGIAADRLTLKTYPGGHMMYLHQPSLEALANDITAFIEAGNIR